MQTDEEYEATRLKFYPKDPPQFPAQKNAGGMYAVQEIIHHGDYRSSRLVELYDLNETTVDAVLQSSAYCYGSWAHSDQPQFQESRAAKLKELVEDLKLGRVNRSIGWSTFRVLTLQEQE